MNNYLHLSAIPVYVIATYIVYKKRMLYRQEAKKRITIARSTIEANKKKIHIKDADNLFNSLDLLEKMSFNNKHFKKEESKEFKESFELTVKGLDIDPYDKKSILSALRVLEYTENSFKFTIYSTLLLSLAFIAQLTFFILDLLKVI